MQQRTGSSGRYEENRRGWDSQRKDAIMPWSLRESHKSNHNSYTLYYHLFFVTYKREPLIDREIAAFLEQFLVDKCSELEVHLLEQGIVCDHAHLVVSLRPTHYIPEVVNYLKGAAAHEANHHHDFQNVLRWMRGYRVDTVSERSLESAKRYAREQYKRHPDKIPQ
jgi:putative transposase